MNIINIADRVDFTILSKYLQLKGWIKQKSLLEEIAIFRKESPEKTELKIPLTREFHDYEEAVYSVLITLSKIEDRGIIEICNDLLLAPSDTIFFKMISSRTATGNIPLTEGFKLLENARKIIYISACDLLQPERFHQILASKKAQQLIDSCMLGQTQTGSFMASIVLPFINVTEDEKPIQLSLFNPAGNLELSFTRKVTQNIMKSIQTIKRTIETDNTDQLLNPRSDTGSVISANFLESILELSEYRDKDRVELNTSWAITVPLPAKEEIPYKISLTKDYIHVLEQLIKELKPADSSEQGIFIGKISKAEAHPDSERRSKGDIILNFLLDEDSITKAKVSLKPKDFSSACEALDKGLHVKIKGILTQSGRTKYIASPEFQIVDT